MLVLVRARVARPKSSGMSLEEVLIARPTGDFGETWGNAPVDAASFASLVYRGV
jgi:hypothetical protein